MELFSRVMQSLIYAGIVSNMVAIGVCMLFHEWGYAVAKCINLTIWIMNYKIHRKNGTF